MPKMRAKMKIAEVKSGEGWETLKLSAVGKSTAYDGEGNDEDNNYARWTPQAELTMTINNPDLIGKFKPGEKYYLDFSEAD